MNVENIKQYIVDNDLIEDVLSSICCHHIRKREGYYTCGNADGDNISAIVCYENDNLSVTNYTRQMAQNKRSTDIFDLIMYTRDCTFPEALKFVCNEFGLDYYAEHAEMPESLQILQLLREMATNHAQEDHTPLQPISEDVLKYYINCGNKMFEDDGIALDVQHEFEIGYDAATNYITIPLRDSIGTLVGIKGRFFGAPDEWHTKYTHIEKCAKSKLLYGYWQNREYIHNSSVLFVLEAEKSVLQLASIGVRNAVAIGSKTISKTQVELITRTGCTPIFAFDKDVLCDELESIASMFMDGIQVRAIIDKDDILNDKESPSDNSMKWAKLIQNNIYQIKGDNSYNE